MAKRTSRPRKGRRRVSAPVKRKKTKKVHHRKGFLTKPQLQKKFDSSKRSLRRLRKKVKDLEARPKVRPLPAALADIGASVDKLSSEVHSRTEQFQEIASRPVK